MDVKVWQGYLVRYGTQDDGREWTRDKLQAVTPNLVGRVVMLPTGDDTLALVIKMEFNEVGLLIHAIPKEFLEKALKEKSESIILPGQFSEN